MSNQGSINTKDFSETNRNVIKPNNFGFNLSYREDKIFFQIQVFRLVLKKYPNQAVTSLIIVAKASEFLQYGIYT
jgi:hypothetical protein